MAEDIWQSLPYKTPYESVFESGWVELEEQGSQNWQNLATDAANCTETQGAGASTQKRIVPPGSQSVALRSLRYMAAIAKQK